MSLPQDPVKRRLTTLALAVFEVGLVWVVATQFKDSGLYKELQKTWGGAAEVIKTAKSDTAVAPTQEAPSTN